MSAKKITSMQRTLTALSHQEPDRVPVFLLLTMHGAKELKLSIKDYFSKAECVAEGQLKMLEKYGHDCVYTIHYAAIETEAWGGGVIFRDDGPPNAAAPLITSASDLAAINPPDVENSPPLQRVLETTRLLKNEVQDRVPIIGVVMAPFSLPVMQLGFERYIELMYEHEADFWRLMELNIQFCVAYANAQLAAGATAICYFDPISSPIIVPKKIYMKTGFEIAKQTLARIEGPTATHFASGNCLSLADVLPQTGTAIVGVSSTESLPALKQAFQQKLTLLGNLNGIEMRRWTEAETRATIKEAIRQGAAGGGFILSDNHGEIPFQVPEATLKTIMDTVREFGQYPIKIE